MNVPSRPFVAGWRAVGWPMVPRDRRSGVRWCRSCAGWPPATRAVPVNTPIHARRHPLPRSCGPWCGSRSPAAGRPVGASGQALTEPRPGSACSGKLVGRWNQTRRTVWTTVAPTFSRRVRSVLTCAQARAVSASASYRTASSNAAARCRACLRTATEGKFNVSVEVVIQSLCCAWMVNSRTT